MYPCTVSKDAYHRFWGVFVSKPNGDVNNFGEIGV